LRNIATTTNTTLATAIAARSTPTTTAATIVAATTATGTAIATTAAAAIPAASTAAAGFLLLPLLLLLPVVELLSVVEGFGHRLRLGCCQEAALASVVHVKAEPQTLLHRTLAECGQQTARLPGGKQKKQKAQHMNGEGGGQTERQ
jgi:hypothetical protein